MFRDHTAAEMAAYLLFRVGAEGMSRRRLLALMYLAERETIRACRIALARSTFMLTEGGPVMREAYDSIMGDSGVGVAWTRRIGGLADERAPAAVRDAAASYAARPARGRLVLCMPQPPYYHSDGTVMEGMMPHAWEGMEDGVPYFGELPAVSRRCLQAVWEQHGGLDEEVLIRHTLALPECGGATSGDLPLKAILQAVGFAPHRIEEALEVAKELDELDELDAAIFSRP